MSGREEKAQGSLIFLLINSHLLGLSAIEDHPASLNIAIIASYKQTHKK